MKCENCSNNSLRIKPNSTQLASWMIPTGPWLSPLRWTVIIGIIATVLFYIVIEPQTGLNIYYGFVPLLISLMALSFLHNVLIFSRAPFYCKLCGHTQQLQEVQELDESCQKCKGHKFVRTWRYPLWVKIIAVLMSTSSITMFVLFAVSLITAISSILTYITTAIGGIWLISFFIIEMRSRIYNHLLLKGSDMIRTLCCTNCGAQQ